jgi:uncharacterized protein YecE (DUF72 family)
MAGRLYVGTSGFAYDAWKNGVFYPQGTRNDRMLEHYASVLTSVEINYTFRRFPSEETLLAWRDQTPPGFRFALKAHMRITHTRRLADAGEVAAFAQRVSALGDRLGPVLFQCPPTLEYDEELITRFADAVPPDMLAAMEFRHPSWSATGPMLAERRIATCIAETDDQHVPVGASLSSEPFTYLRLRRTDYSDDDLRRWAGRIDALLATGSDVHCYFKHEDSGTGPRWGRALRGMVSSR